MTKKQKLLQKIKNNPKHVPFGDLEQLLLTNGFARRAPRSGSSHFVDIRGEHAISVPYRRPYVGEIYVRKVLQMLDVIDEEEDNGRAPRS